MRVRDIVAATSVVLAVGGLGACSSSSKSSSDGQTTTTVANNAGFDVQTPDGTVSLSLDGKLPPGWPSGFPVPDGATPAGSGSLVGSDQGVMIAVYTTSTSPSDTYDFYKSNSSLTISKSGSVGLGSAYVGTIELSGSYDGSIVILAKGSTTNIVITLKGGTSATTETASPTTTA